MKPTSEKPTLNTEKSERQGKVLQILHTIATGYSRYLVAQEIAGERHIELDMSTPAGVEAYTRLVAEDPEAFNARVERLQQERQIGIGSINRTVKDEGQDPIEIGFSIEGGGPIGTGQAFPCIAESLGIEMNPQISREKVSTVPTGTYTQHFYKETWSGQGANVEVDSIDFEHVGKQQIESTLRYVKTITLT